MHKVIPRVRCDNCNISIGWWVSWNVIICIINIISRIGRVIYSIIWSVIIPWHNWVIQIYCINWFYNVVRCVFSWYWQSYFHFIVRASVVKKASGGTKSHNQDNQYGYHCGFFAGVFFVHRG